MKRSLSLDFFKIILSFLIVIVHLYPLFAPDEFRSVIWIVSYCRIPVPCFFIINGYFLFGRIDNFKGVAKYILQLTIVYLVWSTFYAYFYYQHVPITTIVSRYIIGYFHLWYLPALLIAVVLLAMLHKFIKQDKPIFVILITLFVGACLFDPFSTEVYYSRNGIFFGLPFVALGYYLKKYNIKDRFKIWQLALIAIVGLVVISVESMTRFENNGKVTDMLLSTLLICPALVLLVLKKPLFINKSKFTDYFGELSTGIYFIHLFFVFKLSALTYNIYTLPGIFLLSILTTIPIVYINKRAKILL